MGQWPYLLSQLLKHSRLSSQLFRFNKIMQGEYFIELKSLLEWEVSHKNDEYHNPKWESEYV